MGGFVQLAEEHLVADEAANLVLDALGRQIADAVLKLARCIVVVGVAVGVAVLSIERQNDGDGILDSNRVRHVIFSFFMQR